MLILWQDQVAAEVHAVAVASVEVHSVAVHEVAQAASVAALLVVHTVVVSEAHTMEAHLEALIMAVLEDIITLPHHIITIITDHTSGAHTDLGVAQYFTAAASVADAFLPL